MVRALSLLTVAVTLAACGSSSASTSAGSTGPPAGSTTTTVRSSTLSASTATAVSSATTVAGSAGSPGSGGSGGTPACGPAESRSLASGSLSRVYVVAGRTVYGCTRGSAPRRLGITGPCQGPGAIGAAAVAGRDVAVVARACGVDTGSATVKVIRLTDGRTLSSHPAASASAPESFTSVSGLVLAADGTVAWIGQVSSIVRHSTTAAVYVAAPRPGGKLRTLDAGPGVAAGSLSLAGRTVSWRHGSTRRHATI